MASEYCEAAIKEIEQLETRIDNEMKTRKQIRISVKNHLSRIRERISDIESLLDHIEREFN